MTIYEIDQAILDCIDLENGDVIDEEKLAELEMEREQKISGIACWIKELKAEAEAIKNEKQNLEKRQRTAENKAEQLKKYLAYVLNGTKYSDPKVSVSFKKSEEVVIKEDLDPYTLPDDLLNVKLIPDKTKIKKAIKEGQSVFGCELVEKQNVIIK